MGVREIFILSDTAIEGAKTLPLITQCFFSPPLDLRKYDYLVFTSKRGVDAIERITKAWKNLPSFAVGEATAKYIEKLGGQVAGVSNGYGEDLANTIAKSSQKGYYLVVRPKRVVTAVAKILQEKGIEVEEAILYETICEDCQKFRKPSKGSVIIFSSPSTVECFMRCFGWDESYKAVAIGQKTAKALPASIEAHIPSIPTLEACVELAKKL